MIRCRSLSAVLRSHIAVTLRQWRAWWRQLALAGVVLTACYVAQVPCAMAVAASVLRLTPELQNILCLPQLYQMRDAKRRCERSLLDFVELMWVALDPKQPFVRGRVQEAIALHLEAVIDGKIKNLLGNVPPGSTKTYLTSVFLMAWEWGPRNRPDMRYMIWSYSDELALQASDDCRKIINHPIYQQLWGDRVQLDKNNDAKGFYRNTKGGWRRSSSIRGATTGFRADRLIFDDPHNVKDADSDAAIEEAARWFSKSLPTRVRNASGEVNVKVPFWVRAVHGMLEEDPDDDRPVKASATIGIMQRVHLHDISGIILHNPALGYEVLLIEMRYKGDEHPARKLPGWRQSSIGYRDWRTQEGELADPIRFPEMELTRMEAALAAEGKGKDAIAAQMDQWPLQIGGTMFTDAWLPIIERAPHGIDKRGWDFAGSKSKKADRTATACVRRDDLGRLYLMDSHAMRGSPGEVDDLVRGYHRNDAPSLDWSVPQDPGATGIRFAEYVQRLLAPGRYVSSSTELGKVQSAKPVSSAAEHGNFMIVRHEGCQEAKNELIDFPYGDHDDLVDAISRACAAHIHEPPSPPSVAGWTFAPSA